MVRKFQQASTSTPTASVGQAGTTERHAPGTRAVQDQVEKLLQEGQPRRALDLLVRSKPHSPWSTNATGVCMLRLGQAESAVELFRTLLLSGSLILRPDAPTAWKVNFATALLMADNLSGCIQLLAEIQEEQHPGVQRLRAAIRSWQRGLPFWGRLRWFLGGQPARRVELDFPPGEL